MPAQRDEAHRTRQPWLTIPAGVPVVPEYDKREACWPAESLARYQALLPRIRAARRPAGAG